MQDEHTPAVTDCTPSTCPASFLKLSNGVYRKVRLLDLAPDPYLGPYLVELLGVYFTLGRDAFVAHMDGKPEAEREHFHDRLTRYIGVYRRMAASLPSWTLRERRQADPEVMRALADVVFLNATLLTWLLVLLRMEALAFRVPEPESLKVLRSWPEHKKADALRIWFWRQTPSGKASVARSHRTQAKKKGARHAS